MPELTFVLATRSADKAREIRDILGQSRRVRILSLDDAGVEQSVEEEHIESFHTFLGNAHAKAAFFLTKTGIPTIADDSGISVDALHGAPGVRSKRFADAPGLDGKALDEANNQHLLEKLKNVPPHERTAHYTCAAVAHFSDGRQVSALAVRTGLILPTPRGPHGFGYDPLFLDPQTNQSFGEMDPTLKNTTSHRSRAFRALAPLL
jgi:XTP/dITP diphosphohydrolase